MNQIFSFKRYAWLLKSQWYENASIYKIGIVLAVVLTIVIFVSFTSGQQFDVSQFKHIQATVFILSGILVSLAFGAVFFNKLHSKEKGMFYVSLPILPLERIAVTFFCSAIVVPVLFLIIFNIFDFFAVQLLNYTSGASEQMLFVGNFPSNLFAIFLSFFSFFSISAFWSLAFGKKGTIATAFFIAVSITVYALIFAWLDKIGVVPKPPEGFQIAIGYGDDFFVYMIPIWWILMYFVMKRKEVK